MCGLLFMLVSALIGAPALSSGAYLPVIGPAPLRFQSTPPPVSTAESLAIPMDAPPAAVVPDTNQLSATGSPPMLDPNLSDPAAITNHVQSPPPAQDQALDRLLANRSFGTVGSLSDTNLITPQMMLHFFEKDLKQPKKPGVLLSVPFVPPTPWVRPSPKSAAQSQP